MSKIKDTRIQCPYCHTRTWSKNYSQFMRDHDRSDGRVCREAQKKLVEMEKRLAKKL